jgi:hypothetical protein
MHDLASYYLLLVTDDESGKATAFTPQGLAGAVLAQMIIDGGIEVVERRLIAGLHRPVAEPYAGIWDLLDEEEKPRTASRWVGVLTSRRGADARHAVAAKLADEAGLRALLESFGGANLASAAPETERTLRGDLLAMLAGPDEEIDDRTKVLVMLVVFSLASQRVATDRSGRRQMSKRVAAWRKSGLLPEELALVTEAVRVNVSDAASG